MESDNKYRELIDTIERGDLVGVIKILSDGIKINYRDEDGNNALFHACSYGQTKIVKYLISEGIKVDNKSKIKVTSLMEAAYRKEPEIVRILVDHGADIQGEDKDFGDTILNWACKGGCKEIVTFLISKGAPIKAGEKHGNTPLLWASRLGHLDIVKTLISLGADVNEKNKHGADPLSWASGFGYPEIIEYLISKGADVKQSGALLSAVWNGKLASVEYLLSKGADINAKDNKGKTALECAKLYKKKAIEDYLRQHGAVE